MRRLYLIKGTTKHVSELQELQFEPYTESNSSLIQEFYQFMVDSRKSHGY